MTANKLNPRRDRQPRGRKQSRFETSPERLKIMEEVIGAMVDVGGVHAQRGRQVMKAGNVDAALQTALEHAPLMAALLDKGDKVLWANERLRETEFRPLKHRCMSSSAHDGGRPETKLECGKTGTDQPCWVRTLRVPRGRNRVLWLAEDITDSVQAAALRALILERPRGRRQCRRRLSTPHPGCLRGPARGISAPCSVGIWTRPHRLW